MKKTIKGPEIVNAVVFVKALSSGRNKPILLICEKTDGSRVELVVKLSGKTGIPGPGLIFELYSSCLAKALGIQTPTPYIVRIDKNFPANNLVDLHKLRLSNCLTYSFGSEYLSNGYFVWPLKQKLQTSEREVAASIFAFDAMIQNPDRTRENPNLLYNQDSIQVIDHEAAFSFYYDFRSNETLYPWINGNMEYLKNHIFFNQLQTSPTNWARHKLRFSVITPLLLSQFEKLVPDEWQSNSFDVVAQVQAYLIEVSRNIETFFEKLSEVLL